MEGPELPADLRERLRTAGLLEAFLSLPVELQTDFIEFINASKDEAHREGRMEMVANLIRRSLSLILLYGCLDLAITESAARLRDVLAA